MMEDWQQHSLEEKGGLKQLLLTPSDSYTNEGLNEYSEEIKMEPKFQDNIDITNNSAQTDIKTEKVELNDKESNAKAFVYFTNGNEEIGQISGLEFGSNSTCEYKTAKETGQWKEHDLKQLKSPVHERKKPFQCNHCSKNFACKSSLEVHERIHTGEKPYSCNTCNKCFSQSGDLNRHELLHTGEKRYSCTYCSKMFNKKENQKVHERIHTGEKPYPCKTCDKCFKDQGTLKKHELIHTGEKSFMCRYCSKMFNQKKNQKVHERIHTGEKPYSCKTCNKCFRRVSELKRHESKHCGGKNNSKSAREMYAFQCIKVEPSTLQQSQTSDTTDPLLIHEIKEENFGLKEAIPIQIFIKQEEFGTSGYQNEQKNGIIEIKQELIEYSEKIKEEPQFQDNVDVTDNSAQTDFKTEEIEFNEQEDNSVNRNEVCQICGLEFENKAALKIHNSSVHQEGNKDDTNKDCGRKDEFKCNICEYKSGRKSTLKRHIKTVHEGIKDFKCSICEYKTGIKTDLKKHIESVHERIKPFQCSTCDYKTGIKKDLKRHVESVHEGIKPFKCQICQFESASKSYLKRHINSVHEDKKDESVKNESKNNESKEVYNKYAQTTLNVANEIQTSTQTLNIDERCFVPDTFIMKEEPNFEEASNESEMSNVTDKDMSKQVSKPKMSYARLISEALLNSPNGMLILSDIYKSISARHPYYQMNVLGWQNSIRHNLTLNKSFIKCTDGLKKSKDGKYSNYWKLSENLSKSVMKKLSKEELSKIQASHGISNAVVKKEKGKNCYIKDKTSFHRMCKNCYRTFVNKDQFNEHSCLAIQQEPQDIMESVIEDSHNDQKVGFKSINVDPLTIKQAPTSDIIDPLLKHEIKKEHCEENEVTPIQDLTEVYIKQEEFSENELENMGLVFKK